VVHRTGRRPNKTKPIKVRRLRRFARRWLGKNFDPLSSDTDVSFYTWISKCPYPHHRKVELTEKWEAMKSQNPEDYKWVKAFMKDEVYSDYKYPRGIYSRSDEFKCLYGPYVKPIEEELYNHKYFVKHIPVKDRGRWIQERLGRGPQFNMRASDFTAMESSFTEEIQFTLDVVLFQFFYANHSCLAIVMRLLYVKSGQNVCLFKFFIVIMNAKKMSGEMDTSLTNGFANMILCMFVVIVLCKCTDFDCVVEGDDGVFVFVGIGPTSEDFADLGFSIKFEDVTELSEASFCGLVFDPDDGIVVADPREVLCTFGWTTARYARSRKSRLLALLRAKSLSYAHQYPGCPIIAALARYGLRVTRGISIQRILQRSSNMSQWEYVQLLEAHAATRNGVPHLDVPPMTRLLVERKFGISVQAQCAVEDMLDRKNDLEPLSIHQYIDLPPVWFDYSLRYVHQVPVATRLVYPEVLEGNRSKITRDYLRLRQPRTGRSIPFSKFMNMDYRVSY
jgi:hypothetical protein